MGASFELIEGIDRVAAETGFSGVVRIDSPDRTPVAIAFGLADRAHEIVNSTRTRFPIASGSKGFTALTIMHLVELGALDLATTARALLGDDLPLIDDRVTIEHLLAHRSGIGDYLDEDTLDDINDYAMTEPVHRLANTAGFLPMLDGHPSAFDPGERFTYCNGGFVVLALLAERATGSSFHDLVDEHVITPAGLHATAFLRSDELPADAALAYLDATGLRTNVLHLPVRGSGDGGLYTTVADVHTFWDALFAGRIVNQATLAQMVRSHSVDASSTKRYGLGFWLHATTDTVMLEGYDAGVSFRTTHQPSSGLTHTVIANTSEGAWPIIRHLDAALGI